MCFRNTVSLVSLVSLFTSTVWRSVAGFQQPALVVHQCRLALAQFPVALGPILPVSLQPKGFRLVLSVKSKSKTKASVRDERCILDLLEVHMKKNCFSDAQ